MSRASFLALLLGALVAAATAPVRAGTACSERPLSPDAFQAADRLANDLLRVLDSDAREAAVLGRAGSDLSRHGLRFSHAGLAVREHPGAPWRVVHLLNHCGRATGALYREGLINFFLDDPFEYAALVLVPGEALQRRLADVVADGTAVALLEPRYDMLAHPESLSAQNSNQWLLELIAAAEAPPGSVRTRAAAQRWLRGQRFEGDVVRLSTLERLGARMFRANVAFDSQPVAERVAGRITVVTVRAVERHLAASQPGLVRRVLSVRGPAQAPRSRPPALTAVADDRS